jgi:prevent-host-death family protein
MRTMTSVEAQNRFGELLDAAQREPVTITRRGRPVAFVISQQDYEALTRGREKAELEAGQRAAIAAITTFRGSGPKGTTADLLRDREVDRLREK